MKTETKYKVCAYGYYKDRFSYVNEDTTDPKNGWITHANLCDEETFKEKNIPLVKYFDSLEEAKICLKIVKNYMTKGWKKTPNGEHKKPQWKIYKESQTLLV
jgi:hypothetical protein